MRKKGSGETVKISKLLSHYKDRFSAPESVVLDTLSEVLTDLGFSVPKNTSSYSPTTKIITIKNSGMLRSEILIQKKVILTHLRGRLGERSAPKDII